MESPVEIISLLEHAESIGEVIKYAGMLVAVQFMALIGYFYFR